MHTDTLESTSDTTTGTQDDAAQTSPAQTPQALAEESAHGPVLTHGREGQAQSFEVAESLPEPLPASIVATAPGQVKVIKRNGTVVPYTDDKIAVALTKAFLAVEGGTAAASPRIRELVAELTGQVSNTFKRRFPSGGTIHIEDIQDQVELALMRSGEHKVARD